MKYTIENNKICLYKNENIVSYAILDKNIIKEIYVDKNFRNISYGTKTIAIVRDYLKKKKYDEIIVEEFDNASYNFFKKIGFKLNNNSLVYSGLQEELKQEKTIIITSILSFILNLLLASSKLFIGYTFKLSSITADGINAASDCITNLLVILGFSISNKLEDETHPFGYSKIESIFSLFIGIIISYSAFSVLIENVYKLIRGTIYTYDKNTYNILLISFVFIIIKIIQYISVKYVAFKYNNILLKAIIKDYLSDILVSISVFLGILLTIKFNNIVDIVLGIIISLYIIYQGINIIKENTTILIDTQDKNLLKQVEKMLLENVNIKYVHDLYMISNNKYIYIYADVRVDKNLTVEKSHEIAEKVSLDIRSKIKIIKKLTLHIEPIY